LLDTAVAATHVAIQTIAKAASSIVNKATVYVKANTRDTGELRVSDQSGNGVRIAFNLTTATITAGPSTQGTGFTVGSASITSVGSGWYRVELSATSNTATVLGHEIYVADASGNTSYTGNGSGFYAWGAQLEAGAFATSYIPTVASQVTRAADQVSILTSAFPYSQTEGTLFTISSTVVYNDGGAAYRTQTALRNAGNTNFSARIRLQQPTTTTMQPNGLIINTTTQADLLPSAVALTEMRAAMAYKVNDAAMVVNGGAASIDVICTIPSDISSMDMLGGPFNNGATHIKRLAYYASRKDNSTLQVLST
jgi:hypothetical protein